MHKMKVALISPKGNIFGKNKKLNEFLNHSDMMQSFKMLWTGPNLGLLTLAALLPPDWGIDYIDENYKEIDYGIDYDIVFVSIMTRQANRGYEIIHSFKQKNILTIVGGIHASVMPEEAALHADVVLVGEAEVVWQEFYNDYLEGCYKKIYNQERLNFVSFDMECSPIPRIDLIKNYKYPIVSIQTTRGCPHDCSFCAGSKIFGSRYRRKSNKRILEEIRQVCQYFPDTLILFADDNVFVKREASKDLLESLRGINIRWIAQTDISIADDERLLLLMAQAGCQWVVIGFESVSFTSLNEIDRGNWKQSQFYSYEEKIKIIQSYGIGIYGTFIVGLDKDGEDIFKDTSKFIINNNLYGANITVPTPLPGTRMRERLQEQGRILSNVWSEYTLWDVVAEPQNMDKEQLENGLFSIYEDIASEKAVLKRLSDLKRMAKKRRALGTITDI